jgi:hypothetical protein
LISSGHSPFLECCRLILGCIRETLATPRGAGYPPIKSTLH